MITSSNVEGLVALLLLLFVYMISVTVSEYGQAFVADRLGDDTGRNMGWMNWDPLSHVNLLGFIMVSILGFAWTRFLPVDLSQFRDVSGKTKLFFIYFSYTFFSLLQAFLALLLLILKFGVGVVGPTIKIFSQVSSNYFSFHFSMIPIFRQFYPDASSLVIIFALLLILFFVYNLIVASISLVWDTFIYVLSIMDSNAVAAASGPGFWILLFVIISFLIGYIEVFFANVLLKLVFSIVSLFGLV